MARIQDIKEFETLITDVVNEYIQEMDCYNNPVLAIWRRCGQHYVKVNDPANLKLPKIRKPIRLRTAFRQAKMELQNPTGITSAR